MSKKEIFRKCIATNKIVNINQMIRIVKNKDNNFFLQTDNYIQGRGAYITNEFKLIMQTLEKKTLNKTFKLNISSVVYDNLRQEVKKYEKIKNKEKYKQC